MALAVATSLLNIAVELDAREFESLKRRTVT
jgi:hypothetical protein